MDAAQNWPVLLSMLRRLVAHESVPTILMSVAIACGDNKPEISDAAAAALELIHCASLVHDDLPCFDNADVPSW